MTAIRVELELKDGSFVSGMLRSGQSLASFKEELKRLDPHFRKLTKGGEDVITSFKRADDSTRTLMGSMRDVSIVMGAVSLAFSALTGASGGVIGNIIKVNSEMERLRFQMEGLSDAADPVKDAADQVSYLRDAATRAPFSIKEITSTFVKLKASGTDPMNGSMQALIDGIAAFGGSDEQLHRVTLGITQMTGKGVIQMEEMRQQLGESMPTAMRLMARSMGVSVAELIDAISTGRVEAKSALAGFYQELERAYGGEAQRMMGTFSGQVTQMTANLQRMTTSGGLFEFFENLKSKLQEFNDFLKSPEAQQAADQFGRALSGIADFASDAAKTIYAFRGELKTLAMMIAGYTALKSLSAGFGALMLNIRMTKGEILAGANAFRGTTAAAAAAGTAVAGAGAAAATTGGAFAGMTAIVGGGLRILGAVLPWITLIGTAAYFAADKFGLLGDNTQEAYENLVKYGVESRAQAEQILNAKQVELEKNLEILRKNAQGEGISVTAIHAYDKALKEYEDFLEKKKALIVVSAENEADVEIQKQNRILDIKQAADNAEYDRAQTELDNKYQAEREAAAEAGKSISDIEKKYQEGTLKNRQALIKKHIKLYDDELNILGAKYAIAAGNNDRAEEARLGKLMDNILARRVQMVQDLNSLAQDVFGINLISPVEDEEKKFAKGEKALQSLQEDVKGLQADIGGASGEYAKMLFRIERGDFGSIEEGGDKFKALADDILAATKQKEALDAIMDGRKDAESDLKRLREKVQEEQLKLNARKNGKELTDAEVMLEKLKTGMYAGLGPIENIRKSIQNLASVTQTQGMISEQLGKVLRENTFGQLLLDQIAKVRAAITGMTGDLNGVAGAAGLINFGGMGMPGLSNIKTNVDGGILDLIASRESGGDYNATLDNGRWTNGAQNLSAMTLAQVRELQKMMLANPENRSLYGNGKGSSALGRYQITGQTLEGLMKEMGLTGNELFDTGMQDAMAARLVARRGANPAALRQEWTGLQGVSDADILAALSRSTTGPTVFRANMGTNMTSAPVAPQPLTLPGLPALPTMDTSLYADMEKQQVDYTAQMTSEVEKLDEIEKGLIETNLELDKSDYFKKLKAQVLDANKPLDEIGKTYSKLLDDIRAGKLGTNKNVDAAEYKELLEWAKKVDEAEKARDARKSAVTDADRQKKALDEQRLAVEKDIADAQARIKNPDYKAQSDDVQKLTASLDEYLLSVKTAYGESSQAYIDAKAYRDQMVNSGMQLEGAKLKAALVAETRDTQDAVLTQKQLRQVQLQRDLEMIDARAEAMRAAGMSEVEITEAVEQAKKAIRDKYNKEAMTPMQVQLEQWGKLSDNMQKASANWLDSAASGIAGLITGTGDLQSTINSIISDIANMGVRYMLSSIMPAGKGGAGAAAGAAGKGVAGKAASAATGGAASAGKAAAGKMAVGVNHTGGMVGGSGLARMVNGAVFSHAQKYHAGGMIGGRRLSPGEVPIIAQKGETVLTAEQMNNLGSFSAGQQFQINAPVTVNGSAGTPAQNDDLARKMAKEMDSTMRGVVQDEIRKQLRPGNMMNSGKR